MPGLLFEKLQYKHYCVGHASTSSVYDAALDTDASASQELKEYKGKPIQRRFQSVECGARNVVFIQCEASVCPTDLVHYMLSNINSSDIPYTRYK